MEKRVAAPGACVFWGVTCNEPIRVLSHVLFKTRCTWWIPIIKVFSGTEGKASLQRCTYVVISIMWAKNNIELLSHWPQTRFLMDRITDSCCLKIAMRQQCTRPQLIFGPTHQQALSALSVEHERLHKTFWQSAQRRFRYSTWWMKLFHAGDTKFPDWLNSSIQEYSRRVT